MDNNDIISNTETQLNSFVSVLKKINSGDNFEDILVNIVTEIKNIMSVEAIALFIINSDTKELKHHISIGSIAECIYDVTIENIAPLSVRASKISSPLYSNNPDEDSMFIPFEDALGKELKNILFMPIHSNSKNIASLFLINKTDRRFQEEDADIMKNFADFISIVLINKMIYEESQFKAYEVGALYQISMAINKFETVEEVLKENLSVISEAFEAHRTSIIIKENDVFKFIAGVGIDEDVLKNGVITVIGNPLEEIIKMNHGICAQNVNKDKRYRPNKDLRYKTSSFIAAPLHDKNEIIGFVCATERNENKTFKLSDLQLLEMLAQQIGDNYIHFKLLKEAKLKEKLAAEVEMTGFMQQSILPTDFSFADAFDIFARSIPSENVGGDFYDFIKITESKYALVIADVSGKGLRAGLFMAMCRSIIRVYALENKTPANILKKTNKHLYQDSKSGMFVTVFIAIVDTSKKEIKYSNAGHLNQFLIKSDDNNKISLETLHTQGRPLGVLEDESYTNSKINYDINDKILLFTDGITETFNEESEEYGEERLVEFISSKHFENSIDTCNSIVDDTITFRKEAAQFDDTTIIVAKMLK